MSILFLVLLFFCPQETADEFEIPGLGIIKLAGNNWELEESKTPEFGPHVFVYKSNATNVERITIVRYSKHQGNRGLTLKDSYRYCDAIADSIFVEGKAENWASPAKHPALERADKSTNHMIRLPTEKSSEPLAVTNILDSQDGKHWMNHGLIASNKKHVFLFIHTSTKLLSPVTIENVYLSSPLDTWPRPKTHSEPQENTINQR